MVSPCPLHVPLLTDGRASDEQASGTHCQYSGQQVPKLEAHFWALYFHFPTSFQKKHNEDYNRTQRL